VAAVPPPWSLRHHLPASLGWHPQSLLWGNFSFPYVWRSVPSRSCPLFLTSLSLRPNLHSLFFTRKRIPIPPPTFLACVPAFPFFPAIDFLNSPVIVFFFCLAFPPIPVSLLVRFPVVFHPSPYPFVPQALQSSFPFIRSPNFKAVCLFFSPPFLQVLFARPHLLCPLFNCSSFAFRQPPISLKILLRRVSPNRYSPFLPPDRPDLFVLRNTSAPRHWFLATPHGTSSPGPKFSCPISTLRSYDDFLLPGRNNPVLCENGVCLVQLSPWLSFFPLLSQESSYSVPLFAPSLRRGCQACFGRVPLLEPPVWFRSLAVVRNLWGRKISVFPCFPFFPEISFFFFLLSPFCSWG